MAKTKKPQKSILNEGTVRRFMKLAGTPELSESFFSEDYGKGDKDDRTTKKGQKDEPDEDDGYEKDAFGAPGKGGKTEKGKVAYRSESLFAEEDDEEEALEGELGAEDEVADEEGAELDAEAEAPTEGEAEITPEAAQAIIDLGAQLEAAGAAEEGAEEEAEGAEDIELGAEEEDFGAEEEELAEFRGLEEQLASLGIEVVDDRQLKENCL